MPDQFWSLLVREFHLKHAAFMRSEDRLLALIREHSMISVGRDDQGQLKLQRQINALRRYPIKAWLRSE